MAWATRRVALGSRDEGQIEAQIEPDVAGSRRKHPLARSRSSEDEVSGFGCEAGARGEGSSWTVFVGGHVVRSVDAVALGRSRVEERGKLGVSGKSFARPFFLGP